MCNLVFVLEREVLHAVLVLFVGIMSAVSPFFLLDMILSVRGVH